MKKRIRVEEKYYFDINEEYPASFDKQHFYGLRSFAERARYCAEHLPKIAAGSGRIVYKIDDKTVLKLAKNPKGIAQNLQEAQIGGDNYWSNIVTAVYNYDQDDKWIESELAMKAKPNRFKELTGVDINTAGNYFMYREGENNPRPKWGGKQTYGLAPEQIEQLHENQFLADVVELMYNYNLKAADFTRLSSFGEVNRDGHPAIVVVDYGLSDEVWSDHYERKVQSPNMHRW